MSLQYSELEQNKEKKRVIKNQTLKNRNREKTNKVKEFLESANEKHDGLYDIPTDKETKSQTYNDYTPNYQNEEEHTPPHNNDESISVEAFNTLQNKDAFIPYYNEMSLETKPGKNQMFTDKLNYMIHLLEEQQDEKTGHATEELILYCFLGVFMIFMVDSFARVGKYVR